MHFLVFNAYKSAFFRVLLNLCVIFIRLVPFSDIAVLRSARKNQLETPSHGLPCLVSLRSSPNTPYTSQSELFSVPQTILSFPFTKMSLPGTRPLPSA